MLDAVQSHDRALMLIALAGKGSRIELSGFTFDRSDIVEQLMIARVMGADVKVLLDESSTLSGRTRDVKPQVTRLLAGGVAVKTLQGESVAAAYREAGRNVSSHFRGIHHAKTIRVDDYMIVTSCNWTTSSRSNFETGILMRIESYGEPIVTEKFAALWRLALVVTSDDLAKDGDQRARSVSRVRF
jgi:phosphatidylserine/phosphatidylglycerophosphate/cardiolipin synthase-like enzyme